MLVPLHRLNRCRKKRNQPFATQMIGLLPHLHQCRFDLGPVHTARGLFRHLVLLLGMVQEPHGIFAMIARQTNKILHDHAFVCGRCLVVLQGHLSEDFTPHLQTRSHLHLPPPRSLDRLRCHNDSDICSCLIQNLPVSSHITTFISQLTM